MITSYHDVIFYSCLEVIVFFVFIADDCRQHTSKDGSYMKARPTGPS